MKKKFLFLVGVALSTSSVQAMELNADTDFSKSFSKRSLEKGLVQLDEMEEAVVLCVTDPIGVLDGVNDKTAQTLNQKMEARKLILDQGLLKAADDSCINFGDRRNLFNFVIDEAGDWYMERKEDPHTALLGGRPVLLA